MGLIDKLRSATNIVSLHFPVIPSGWRPYKRVGTGICPKKKGLCPAESRTEAKLRVTPWIFWAIISSGSQILFDVEH
jgi:hypothetical protein